MIVRFFLPALLLFLSHTAVALVAIFFLMPEPAGTPVAPVTTAPQVITINTDLPEPAPVESIENQPSLFKAQLAAHQIAARSDGNETRRYLGRYLEEKDPFYREVIAMIFLERLIEIDPRQAADYAATVSVENDLRLALQSSVVTSWFRYDPQAAIQHLKNIGDVSMRNQIGARLLLDPTVAGSSYAAEIQAELGSYGRSLVSAARQRQLSPEAALDDALRMTGNDRRRMLMNAVSRLAQTDPEAALERISTLTNASERQMAMQMLIANMARKDAFEAYEILQNSGDYLDTMLSTVVPMMMSQDPERGLPYLRSFVDSTGNFHVIANAVTQWATHDLNGAIAFAETLTGQVRTQTLSNLSINYLQRDPDTAMQWVSSLEDTQVQQRAFSMLPQLNLQLAEDWLGRLEPDDPGVPNLLAGIANQKSNQGFDAAMAWLSDYEDYAGYANAVRNALSVRASRDPAGVADYLEAYGEDSSYRGSFQQLASSWASDDPESARDWALSLPEGDNRQEALATVILQDVYRDRPAQLDLLDELDDTRSGRVRQQIAQVMVSRRPGDAESIASELGVPLNQLQLPPGGGFTQTLQAVDQNGLIINAISQ